MLTVPLSTAAIAYQEWQQLCLIIRKGVISITLISTPAYC